MNGKELALRLRTLCACLASALLAHEASALVIVVPTHQPTIQAAINVAANGDTILLADGIYSGPGNYNIDFLGKAVTLRSIDGPDSCVIDAKATQMNQHMIFWFHSGETSASVVQGITIRGGWQFNGPAFHVTNNSSPTVRNCVITENHADCWGGAIYYEGTSSPTFEDCKIVNNLSTDDGGAIFGLGGSPIFKNCLIANNEGTYTAGAILAWGSGSPKLINCTVTGNHANFGAVYSNILTIENSIIWGNLGDQQIRTAGTATIPVHFSNVEGGYTGIGNINVTPQFENPAAGDYHLMTGSACIDAGDPATVVAEGTFDFDGDPRSFGVHIDMGIDEFRRPGDATGDHSVNMNDLLAVVNGWGPCTWSTADLNGDFQINLDDLLMVITNWG